MKEELLNVNKSVLNRSVISRTSQFKNGQTKFDMKSLEDSFKFQFDDFNNLQKPDKFKIKLEPKLRKPKKALNKVTAKSVNYRKIGGKEGSKHSIIKIEEEEESSEMLLKNKIPAN